MQEPAPSENFMDMYELHISRAARLRYQFDEKLFTFDGRAIFVNFHAVRQFAQKINAKRDIARFPEQAVQAGQINAMGLINEIFHFVIQCYRQQRLEEAFSKALRWLDERLGVENVNSTLSRFIELFPPLAVYKGEVNVSDYMLGVSKDANGFTRPNREIALEELLTLWLSNVNPAFAPYRELFDDEELITHTAYRQLIEELERFFNAQPAFGPDDQPLVEMLRSPAIAVPHSLDGQLEFIRTRWGYLLGEYFYRLLRSLDMIREERKAVFSGSGSIVPYDYRLLDFEAERFSPDREWMTQLILIAKNTYVWLDQLSKKYQRSIRTLDQIPEEELRLLADWGFTGLWLIGLWERSPASRKIKQLRGKEDAVASAYSIFSYDIANDLGGESAFQALRKRAWRYGIRLASDMVPNHMGIDAPWVMEHPDWFIQLPYSPYPSYRFSGPNLSWNDHIGIYLEDHYYDSTDAAVVFKRVDHHTGEERYIYHGNDGTFMPWNDTAQLNYLLPEVREAVIQVILHVARKFPIIRFDAAMTLAKRHYQRLWFPEPGSGGDIPSRAEYGLTKAEFDRHFPDEFWREVVDRVAAEQPDTLLLAEAFWLMEGYFVRTLGMHRVYNSAFMNMLRDEKNQEYRLVIKNTLEFDPQILKRFVNFMNNPDERTAVDQFGKADKYFGVCTLMVTLPGLPMFGHGQVEGFAEKYGMEFQRAYWDEQPDGDLIHRHEREIFPLLRRRALFSGVEHFLLYDFYTSEGVVNEDIFAYSNRQGDERALVIYNNRYHHTQGWIRVSTPYPQQASDGQKHYLRLTLAQGLALPIEPQAYVVFRDHVRGLEYLRQCQKLHQQGLFVELQGYQYHVFLDFRIVWDDAGHPYAALEQVLDGRGVPSMEEALREFNLRPIHQPFDALFSADFLQHWAKSFSQRKSEIRPALLEQASAQFESNMLAFYHAVQGFVQSQVDVGILVAHAVQDLKCFEVLLDAIQNTGKRALSRTASEWRYGFSSVLDWGVLFAYEICTSLGVILSGRMDGELSRTYLSEWLLHHRIVQVLIALGADETDAWQRLDLLRALLTHALSCMPGEDERPLLPLVEKWLADEALQRFLKVHRYQQVLWFNREAFEQWAWWMSLIGALESIRAVGMERWLENPDPTILEPCLQRADTLLKAMEASGYQVVRLLEILESE